jgi:hypothetical protein
MLGPAVINVPEFLECAFAYGWTARLLTVDQLYAANVEAAMPDRILSAFD